MSQKIAEGRILFPKKRRGRPREKVFLAELQTSRTGFPSIIDGVYTADGSAAIRAVFGEQLFAFPKPPGLVEMLVEQATESDSLVMDSFAGSGTTGHAVLRLNQTDGGARRFILVEMDAQIAKDVTAPRLTAVVEGKGDTIPALGGGFRYCKLGPPLFDEGGNIRAGVRFPELAAHVFFTETGVPIPKRPRRRNGEGGHPHPDPLPERERGYSPLLGVHNGKAVYLLFNGVLGDKRPDGGNVLTGAVLSELPPHDGPRIVYGEGCRLGPARLKREGIVFRQIPYEIKVT